MGISVPYLATIIKLTKSGWVTVNIHYADGSARTVAFSPRGRGRGYSYDMCLYNMARTNMTEEKILAEQKESLARVKAAEDQIKKKREDLAAKRKQAVADFWKEKGCALWNNAPVMTVDVRGNTEYVRQIRYTNRFGDDRLIMVMQTQRTDFGRDEIQLHCVGFEFRISNGTMYPSTFSCSPAKGNTIEEAVYDLLG